MKRTKLIIAAFAVVAVAVGSFAFKATKVQPNDLWYENSSHALVQVPNGTTVDTNEPRSKDDISDFSTGFYPSASTAQATVPGFVITGL